MLRPSLIPAVLGLILFPSVAAPAQERRVPAEERKLPSEAEWRISLFPNRVTGTIAPEQPIVIDIVDPRRIEPPSLRPDSLPIFLEGLQPRTFDELRTWLRVRSDPTRFPDIPYGSEGTPLTPSRRELRIRCDATQVFGYVQAVLQAATFRPGAAYEEELATSPLLHRVTLELAGTGRAVATPLPVDRSLPTLDEPPAPEYVIVLRVPRDEWDRPAHERKVVLLPNGNDEPFGTITGLAPLTVRPGDLALQVVPLDTFLQIREALIRVRSESSGPELKLNASPRAPFAAVFAVLELARDAGVAQVAFSGIPQALVTEIEGGKLAGTTGLAELVKNVELITPGMVRLPATPTEPMIRDRDVPEHDPQLREEPRKVAEEATKLALDWFARHQSEDGRWSLDSFVSRCEQERCTGRGQSTFDTGGTGLALLAFLGAGHTHRDGAYMDQVARGLKWLKSQQDAEGCFGPRSDPQFSYNHAIATLAMTEAYGMTRSGIWRSTAQNGLNFIQAMQNPYKGWRYGVKPGDNDSSVTSWMLVALCSGRDAKLEVAPTSLRWGLDLLDELTDEETGRTGYTKRGSFPVRAAGQLDKFPATESESLTAAAIHARIRGGENPESDIIQKGVELLRKRLPRWEPDRGAVDMYYWHFGSLAMHQVGGPPWHAWNAAMLEAIPPHQVASGCARGSWDPIGPWGEEGGRVYATALMTLCLEVYYRDARSR